MRRFAGCLSLLLVLVLAAPAVAIPRDTTVRTIRDRDGDNLLEFAPGEDYTVIGDEQSFRPPRQGSILNFIQLSDFQMVDEESPGRVEFLDKTQRGVFTPFSAAYRPQESLTTQVTEAMVRAVRNTTSPVTSEQIEMAILTGDNADSQQYNETRWFVDILDGTTGDRDEADLPQPGDPNVPPELTTEGFTFVDKIDPNSGVEGTCGDTNPGLYDGVKGGGEHGYYDPDVSGPNTDGSGYSPLREENFFETPFRDVTVRDFPGLFESAQQPFEAIGLDIPWFSAFGNHDALVQGNSSEAYFGPNGPLYTQDGEVANPTFQSIVTGCAKPDDSALGQNEGEDEIFDILNSAVSAVQVPRDDRRCYLAKDEAGVGAPGPCGTAGWIEQHFLTSGAPVGHGFAPSPCVIDQPPAQEAQEDQPCFGYGRPPQADANNDGYYSFSPRPGLRFLTLDTITDECGAPVCAEGSVDDTQFDWMKQQLQMAEAVGEYVMIFSHHTLRTTRFPSADPSEYSDPADPTTNGLHYGQRVEHEDDKADPDFPQNTTGGQTLEDLYCDFPNVLAHIAGHEHENYVRNYDCDGAPAGSAVGPSAAFGGFWHVSTSAHIDWPQQSRMIELVDNMDEGVDNPGTMSLVLTMLDHDGPPNPGGGKPDLKVGGKAGEQVLKLASIARELAYNDYQNSRGSLGEDPADRNVIIVLNRPWPYPSDEDQGN
ncbi:MAG: hypothetical protein M3198_15045 [Actinomycetota bacterium]|nr:hypothetical protein [Actinomycetota bacterium]